MDMKLKIKQPIRSALRTPIPAGAMPPTPPDPDDPSAILTEQSFFVRQESGSKILLEDSEND